MTSNLTSQETIEHFNYMRVGVSFFVSFACVLLWLEES